MKKILIITLIFVVAMMTNVYASEMNGVSTNGVGIGGNPPE